MTLFTFFGLSGAASGRGKSSVDDSLRQVCFNRQVTRSDSHSLTAGFEVLYCSVTQKTKRTSCRLASWKGSPGPVPVSRTSTNDD